MAIVLVDFGARYLAASADIAAVRSAVKSVISVKDSGYPVLTSASSPKAVTVSKPLRRPDRPVACRVDCPSASFGLCESHYGYRAKAQTEAAPALRRGGLP